MLKSWHDRWGEGLQESESGLDRNDEHRARPQLQNGGEKRAEQGEKMWQREIYGKRKLERERERGKGGCWGVAGEYVMKERRAFSE